MNALVLVGCGGWAESAEPMASDASLEDTFAEHDRRQITTKLQASAATAERQSAWRGVVHSVEAQPESLETIRRIVDTKKRELDDLVSYLQESVGPTKVRAESVTG